MCFRPPDVSIDKVCPQCGKHNNVIASVCADCGAALPDTDSAIANATEIPEAPVAPGAKPVIPKFNAIPKIPSAPIAPQAPKTPNGQ